MNAPVPPLAPLPTQPPGVPWPTEDWPTGAPRLADPAALTAQVEAAFSPEGQAELGDTQAVVIVQAGRLVLERYAAGRGPDDTCRSWSTAKSIVHALMGLAVGDGLIDTDGPVDAPEWRQPGDPRAAITIDQMLRMSSGLAFAEDYVPGQPSDVQEMLWGAGKADIAHYAASQPLIHAPGAFYAYASGTTNILCRRLGSTFGRKGSDFAALMGERLFAPLGMTSAAPKFDAAGTFIGSSYCFATPRDFARFGLLYLRDGVWDGRRLLPEGWVDHGRTPTWRQPGAADGPHGAHWWLGMAGPGSFSANGHGGQYILVCPDRDLVIVRNGDTPLAIQPRLQPWMNRLAGLFRQP